MRGRTAASALKQNLVIQAEAQLGHAAEEDAHLDCTNDLRAQHVAVRIGEHVDRFDDIEENLVFAVLDALGAPRHGVCNSHRRPRGNVELVRLLCDVLAQNLALGELRVTKVHHFVQQLVDDDKVVANTLFLQILKVLLKHLASLVQVHKQRSHVGVAPGEREHCSTKRKGEG